MTEVEQRLEELQGKMEGLEIFLNMHKAAYKVYKGKIEELKVHIAMVKKFGLEAEQKIPQCDKDYEPLEPDLRSLRHDDDDSADWWKKLKD
jgi:chromosome segregation ATPase